MASARSRIFDAFLFFNELEMLELRLNILDPVVDRFVLVESTVTFSGRPKPLYYAEHQVRFAPWRDKIIHVVVDDTPDTGAWRWGREYFQRDQIMRGLLQCRCDDIVLLSDCDEIPDPAAVRARARGGYHQEYMLYYLNCRHMSEDMIGTAALYYFQFAAFGPQATRHRRWGFPRIERGGWHFAYAMSPERIRAKLRAFSHDEFDTPEVAAAIEGRRERLEDIFAVHAGTLTVQDIENDYFPDYLKANWRRYAELCRTTSTALAKAPAAGTLAKTAAAAIKRQR
jgi:beta-1,4-mannosyl-glycoprotein beta-1,4-N-acetylglucosaminyltransferase